MGIRRVVSTALAALVVLLSAAVPLLERADRPHEPVVESEHNPTTCPPAHDHTICTQVGSNLAVPSRPPSHLAAARWLHADLPAGSRTVLPVTSPASNRSRAPPAV